MASRTSKRAAAGGRKAKSAPARSDAAKPASPGDNPLLRAWTTPFAMPPFDRIEISHFVPAFDRGFARNRKEIRMVKIHL